MLLEDERALARLIEHCLRDWFDNQEKPPGEGSGPMNAGALLRRLEFQNRGPLAGLEVGHRRAARLGEGDPGAEQQRAATQIGQRQHHVEILAHVTMMQEVVPVQPEENTRTFHVPFLRQVHAPVHVLVGGEIHRASRGGAAQNPPFVREQGPD